MKISQSKTVLMYFIWWKNNKNQIITELYIYIAEKIFLIITVKYIYIIQQDALLFLKINIKLLTKILFYMSLTCESCNLKRKLKIIRPITIIF